MNAYRSLDDGDAINFSRLSYADADAGTDTFCMWSAVFAGDDQVVGFDATLPPPPPTDHHNISSPLLARSRCPHAAVGQRWRLVPSLPEPAHLRATWRQQGPHRRVARRRGRHG